MFEYMTVQDAAKLWGISVRRVQKLCEENRIDGIVRLPRAWLIPQDAQKPADGRYKQNKKKNTKIAYNKVYKNHKYFTKCFKNEK